MRRIKDGKENETLENAQRAYGKYSEGKRKRRDIIEYEKDLDANLRLVLDDIINETFVPKGYKKKVIFEKKERQLAKAPVHDHVTEAAAILPYEQQVYDGISWRAPAVRPGLGNHAMFRFIRNDLYRSSQREVYYNLSMDIHHYFPMMDHIVLKQKVDNRFKSGKIRRLIYKVIDSYQQGAPLGIKLAQLYGMLYFSDFDRLAERCFRIADDPEKLTYWKQWYISEKIMTARTPDEEAELAHGSIWLGERFERFCREGLKHYYRFVDNLIVMHEDKTFLRFIRIQCLMILERDYHCTLNQDHQIRPTWMGIRVCGYVFFHDHVEMCKRNKQQLARNIRKLQKKGLDEEQIRIRQSSLIGFVKHADTVNLFKKLGMEKTLGKIIKKRRVKPPFKGMAPEQKVPFSSIVTKHNVPAGGELKLFLTDYVITDSKIAKKDVAVTIEDSNGNTSQVIQKQPEKVLAIRFKRIIRTTEITENGKTVERYQFAKNRDSDGYPTEEDAEYYAFTGSKIMIDQAERDFSIEDLPCPTVIQEFEMPNGKTYTKFT